jgi:hypothetical protein
MKNNYLIIEHTRIGYRIKNDATGDAMHYIGYSMRNAEIAFRKQFDLKYKHFQKIYI